MTHSYRDAGLTRRLRNLGLTALLAAAAVGTAQAQLGYTAANVTNTQGTYTDLGGTGTLIATANTDDANSTAQSIGFPFQYNGASFTQFVLNTNGFMKLGAAAPTGPAYTDGGQSRVNGTVDGPDQNLLMPFNQDLIAGSAGGTEYRVATTGTAPNRICTIQWKNVSDKPRAASTTVATVVGTQYANFSFQVKLYEINNSIDFVYGTATAGAVADDFAKFVTVGIKGSTSASVVLGTKASATPWAQSTFLSAPYTANAHNVRGTQLPTAGRTYGFTIPVTNDAAVQIIYGFGKLISPAGTPVDIRAVVRNAGTAALGAVTVTLTVSGANTYTQTQVVPSLGILATNNSAVVTFPAVPLPNLGNNTLTVSVPSDGNINNNTQTQLLVSNSTTTSYITAGLPPVSAFGFAGGAMGNYFGAKITLTQPRDFVAVNAFFFNEMAAVGSSAYGVLIDATSGALLGRSADFVVTAASLNQLHTFTLTAPVTVPAGDVIVGMATVAAAATTPQFFLMGVQSENPNRSGAYFTGSATAATPAAPNPALNTATTNIYRYMLEGVTAAPATCPTATNIALGTVTTTSAAVSFTGPTNATGYQLVYVPAGTTPTAASPTTPTFTASPYTLTGLTDNTGYDVYVRVLCGATDRSQLAGPLFFSTPCTPPIVNGAYSQNFDTVTRGQDLPCGITVLDANNDANTWGLASTVQITQAGQPLTVNLARSAPNAMVYFVNANGTDFGDDWFFLPAIRFQAGSRYRLAFWYKGQRSTFVEKLEVKYGISTTPADQTNLLYSNTAISSPTFAQATNTSTPVVADIVPTTTGLKYIGFHAFSDPDQLFLAVDDITVTGVLATSDAMNRAVSIYPNPSNTGSFNLEIHGANAKEALQVEVTNMLGQRVYAGAAKDNFSNQLDLSNLANGIYTLKVRNGAEYMQQQLSIVK